MPLLLVSPSPLSVIHHAQISSDSTRHGVAYADSPIEPSGKGTTIAPMDEFDMFEPLSKWLVADADNDSKLDWLRSQIIGAEVEFDSPFGRRRITYSDHTASGRFLRFVEEFLLQNVLPFYGTFLNLIVIISIYNDPATASFNTLRYLVVSTTKIN